MRDRTDVHIVRATACTLSALSFSCESLGTAVLPFSFFLFESEGKLRIVYLHVRCLVAGRRGGLAPIAWYGAEMIQNGLRDCIAKMNRQKMWIAEEGSMQELVPLDTRTGTRAANPSRAR